MGQEQPRQLRDPTPFRVRGEGVELAGERSGEGPSVVLLHGLTGTRRYVLMGSRLLERRGYELIGFDARSHGDSTAPRDPGAHEYTDMIADLERVLDHLRLGRVVLAGSSMGAATCVAYALADPDRVHAMVLSTPAYAGTAHGDAEDLALWDRLADGLERAGVDGFMEAFAPQITGRWADSIERLTRQRLERHGDPRALSHPLRVVPRSEAFSGIESLAAIRVPALVIGSRDEADPTHPLTVAEEYARRIPDATLLVEAPGRSPLAWHGAQLSRAVDDFLRGRVPEAAARHR